MGDQQQWFIGLCRAGLAARGACLDMLGRPLTSFAVAWSAEAVRRLIDTAHQAASERDIEVVVGVEAESLDNDAALALVLAQSGVRVMPIRPWMVEALWRSHKRRRQTAVCRAQCIAQVLLIAECPPRPLRLVAAPLSDPPRHASRS